MLSLKQLKDVCLVHQGSNMCRYLKQDDASYDKWYCLKKSPANKTKIDDRVAEFAKDCRKRKIDPHATAAANQMPLGDNCPGYLLLKHVEQGYDKP
jgi:hypothetical protein